MIEKLITYSDFMNIDIRIGKVIKAEMVPKALKASYHLWIDFGELGIKESCAQITHFYSTDMLIGKYLVAVVNFPVKVIAGLTSEVLILGAVIAEGRCILIGPDQPVKPGTRIL